MKACSAALAQHLAGDSTTLAYLWKLTRVDGSILGFTTHDVDIQYAPPVTPPSLPVAPATTNAMTLKYQAPAAHGWSSCASGPGNATDSNHALSFEWQWLTASVPLWFHCWAVCGTSGAYKFIDVRLRSDVSAVALYTGASNSTIYNTLYGAGVTSSNYYIDVPLTSALIWTSGAWTLTGLDVAALIATQLPALTPFVGLVNFQVDFGTLAAGEIEFTNLWSGSAPGAFATMWPITSGISGGGFDSTFLVVSQITDGSIPTTGTGSGVGTPGGLIYMAETGMTNSASKGSSDLSADNLEVTAFLESASITESDILASKYDNADVEVRLVNWADLTMGDVLLRKGTVGVVKMKNGVFTAELMGLAHKLAAQIGSSYGPICRATFGSGKNGIDMTSHYKCYFDVTTIRQNATVAAVLDHHTLTPSPLSPPPGAGAAPSSSGAMFPGTTAQVHRQNDWANLGKVTASDGQYATATLYGSNSEVNEASLLQATNFGFAVPSDAVIVGVLATVERQQFSGTSAVYDDTVTLLGAAGSDRRNASPWSPGPAPSGEIAVNYGSPADTWGAALTPAIVNAAAFGIQIGCECTQLPGSGADIGIDSITMTVFYTGAGGGPAAGWFDDGFMTFTSGILDGASFEIKTWDGQNVHLFLPMPVLPAVGDAFWIEPGCNKTTDCQAKYNNIVNFRGEPFIPGMDQLLDYASS